MLKREIIALMLAYLPINVNCAFGVTISTAFYLRLGNGTLFKVPFCFKWGDVLKHYHIIDLLLYVCFLYTAVANQFPAQHFIPPLATALEVPFCFLGVLILWFAMPFSKGLQLRMRLVMGEGKVVAKGENLWYNWLCIKLG